MSQLLTFLVTLSLQVAALLAAPEVQLPNGLIRGYEGTTLNDKHYYGFEKIPYASPPIGELRFKAPIPPPSWEEPLDATNLNVRCYSERKNSSSESEDCLYLNVITPELPSDGNNVSLPVMLFIHGGGFVDGGASGSYADPLVEQDIVFVIINYRLGPFGFLSTQDEVIPGNNGLKDQHMAIKWTHDNIQLFGGDPDKITIFGQSAGSASCSYHLLNQASAGLFSGAILESGSSLSPWAFQRRAREIAFKTASFLNDTFETNNDSNDLLEFLQSVRARDLDGASEQYFNLKSSPEDTEILQGFYWAPVVEVKNPDAFITKKMYGLLEAGNVVAVPILIGMNSEEYIFYAARDQDAFKETMSVYDGNLGWLVPNDMQVTDEANRTEIGRQIREIYTGGEPFLDHLGDGVRFGSDTAFTRSIIKQAELHSQVAKTYFYQFSYNGQLGRIDVNYEGAEHIGHTQELAYLFCHGNDCELSDNPEADQLTRDRMVKIWSNFAKYQNPTPELDELLQNVTWPEVATTDGDFLYVDIGEDLEIRNHPKKATYGKWNKIYASLGYKDFDTY